MAAPVSPSAGQLIDKTFWDTEIYSRWVALYASWASYTPTWTGATTNPTLGNGTLDGAWTRFGDGKLIAVRLRLVIGSTTTLGSGLWSLSLPSGLTPSAVQSLSGFISNQSGSDRYAVGAYLTASAGVFRVAAADGTSGASNSSPLAWTTGDQLVLTGVYETT